MDGPLSACVVLKVLYWVWEVLTQQARGHTVLQSSKAAQPSWLSSCWVQLAARTASKESSALFISLAAGLSLLNELHQQLEQVFFTHRGFTDLYESSLVSHYFGGFEQVLWDILLQHGSFLGLVRL